MYETWNLAFVTGVEENLHLIYPKLFMPAVLDAKEDEYLFNRVLSLWATAQFVILAKYHGKSQPSFTGHEKLAAPWGELNAEYATRYVKKHNHADLHSFWSMFRVVLKKIF